MSDAFAKRGTSIGNETPPPEEKADDEILITRLLTGDAQALEAFLLLHYDWLEGYVRRRIPVGQRGAIASEDIIQEVYLRVFRNLDAFRPEGREQLFSWLQTIARNTLFDAFRKNRRQSRVASESNLPQEQDERLISLMQQLAMDPDTRVSSFVRAKELRRAFWVAMGALSNDYRRVIELLYIEQVPIEDVAEELGKTVDSIRGIRMRARQQIREALVRLSNYV